MPPSSARGLRDLLFFWHSSEVHHLDPGTKWLQTDGRDLLCSPRPTLGQLSVRKYKITSDLVQTSCFESQSLKVKTDLNQRKLDVCVLLHYGCGSRLASVKRLLEEWLACPGLSESGILQGYSWKAVSL